MIAAFGVGSFVDEECIARAGRAIAIFDHGRTAMTTVLGINGRGIANGLGKGVADIGDEGGQRPGRLRHMQHGFVLERIAAHHVHVNIGAHRSHDVRMPAQESHGAFDFGPPNESQGAARTL